MDNAQWLGILTSKGSLHLYIERPIIGVYNFIEVAFICIVET